MIFHIFFVVPLQVNVHKELVHIVEGELIAVSPDGVVPPQVLNDLFLFVLINGRVLKPAKNLASQEPINPHLKYVNLRDHGYLLLTLTKDEAKADWMYVETVKAISDKEQIGKSIVVKNGNKKLEIKN